VFLFLTSLGDFFLTRFGKGRGCFLLKIDLKIYDYASIGDLFFFCLDTKERTKKKSRLRNQVKAQISFFAKFIFKRFILKTPENVFFSVIYFTSVP
jgi:hypothetical protein